VIRLFFVRFLQILKDGIRLWWLAPLIPFIAVATEFYQHYGEVSLGMFVNREAFADLAQSAERMAWATPKLVGVMIAMVASAQYWPTRARGISWWSTRIFLWKKLGIATALNVVITVAGSQLMVAIGGWIGLAVYGLLLIMTLPLLVYTAAALFGDDRWSIERSFRDGWGTALRIGLYMLMLFVPLQFIHGFNHQMAFGQEASLVWSLMIWDSILVGLIATWLGTAVHHGFQSLSQELDRSSSAS